MQSSFRTSGRNRQQIPPKNTSSGWLTLLKMIGSLFQQEHGSQCPGVVSVDFYGDGRPTFGVVLLASEAGTRKAQLVIAAEVQNAWKLDVLDTTIPTFI